MHTCIHVHVFTSSLFNLILHIDTKILTKLNLECSCSKISTLREALLTIGITQCVRSFNFLPCHKFLILSCLVNVSRNCVRCGFQQFLNCNITVWDIMTSRIFGHKRNQTQNISSMGLHNLYS